MPTNNQPRPIDSPIGRHKAFLRGLNEQVIRPSNVPLETMWNNALAGTPAASTWTMPSDKDLFVHGIKGYMERVPSAQANFPEDPEIRNANFVTLQVNANPTDVNLFTVPIRLSALASWPNGANDYLKFPIPWRIQGGALITVTWAVAPGMPATARFFGVVLIGEVVTIADL
jgi:hypothetical protein